MANCQNHMNMRGMYRSSQSSCSSSSSGRRQAYSQQGPCMTGRVQRTVSGCPNTTDFFPEDTAIAMAYVPWQKWEDLLEPCKGLEHGTIFSQLDKPFLGKGGRHR